MHFQVRTLVWIWALVAPTVACGAGSAEVENRDGCSQASDICHELAHLLLEHTPGRVSVSLDGSAVMRSYDAGQEDEANWLAWSLLLPRLAFLHTARLGMDIAQVAEHFGVSETLVRFRM